MNRLLLALLALIISGSAYAGFPPPVLPSAPLVNGNCVQGTGSSTVGPASQGCSGTAGPTVIGSQSIATYYGGSWTPGNSTTNTEQIQAWINSLYVTFMNLDTTQALQNLNRTKCIEAIIPATANIFIDSPLYIPNGVCPNFKTAFVRKGSAGAITANYTGDPSTQALANIYQPAIIENPGVSNVGPIEIIANSTGTDGGSGFYYGRTSSVMTLTIAAAGTGFTGGETCTTANGDVKSPYTGAQFTVTAASGGAATAISYTGVKWDSSGHSGIYPFPLLMQQAIWTAANGWTGSRQVFDGSGNYLTNCTGGSGTGTGLTVTAVMFPDWCTGSNGCAASTTYYGAFSNPSPQFSWLGTVRVAQSRLSTSGTYGPTIGILIDSYDTHFHALYSQLAQDNIVLHGADLFGDEINTVQGGTEMIASSGGNMTVPNVVLNGGSNTTEYLSISNCISCSFAGGYFTDPSTTPNVSAYAIGLGDGVSAQAQDNAGLNLNFVSYNGGSATPATAINCTWTRSSTIKVFVQNVTQGGGT